LFFNNKLADLMWLPKKKNINTNSSAQSHRQQCDEDLNFRSL
jgi:hypothetical protein